MGFVRLRVTDVSCQLCYCAVVPSSLSVIVAKDLKVALVAPAKVVVLRPILFSDVDRCTTVPTNLDRVSFLSDDAANFLHMREELDGERDL